MRKLLTVALFAVLSGCGSSAVSADDANDSQAYSDSLRSVR